MTNFPFSPIANTTNMSPTTATASLNFISTWPYQTGGTLRVVNSSNNYAFIAFGNGAAPSVTTATGMPILPNSAELFTVGAQNWASAISTGTAALYFTPGQGGV